MIDASALGRLAGLPVRGKHDEPLGHVHAVYEAVDGGGGTFATVRPGSGGAPAFFPLHDAVLRGDAVVVPWTRAFVQGAPAVADADELGPQEQQRLLAHYATGSDGQPTADSVIRSEERLHIGTERVAAGRAVLRKRIVTETESRTVTLLHEEVRIAREPIGRAEEGFAGLQLSEEVHEIVLTGEQPVIEREVVPVERVRLATQDVTRQVEVTEDVRKEQVDVDEVSGATGTGDDTEVRSEIVFEPRRDEVVDVPDDGAETRTEIVFEPRR